VTIDGKSMPTGTVTFLLTDVEGSTRGWETAPQRMHVAIARQFDILAASIEAHEGYRPVEQGEGDSVVGAFERASDAVGAAVDAQRVLLSELDGVFRVRMALHTGEAAVRRAGDYEGPTIIRAARLRACGHGGQILVSRTTADLVTDQLPSDVSLVCLGHHRLRDLNRTEEVWQLGAPDLPSVFPALLAVGAVRTNLPAPVTPLVGRDAEVAELSAILQDDVQRLVTLTGSGGVGKTRLALHVAADNLARYPDGVWLVELAAVTGDDRVAEAVARVLGLPEASDMAPLAQLTRAFANRRTLLVLDNCEHVLSDCALMTDELLRSGTGLTVLTTSREPLGTSAETVWRVPSLSLPASSAGSVDELTASDAVRLFIDRARQARSRFTLTGQNAPAVRDICVRLDGIPLALELAAARVRVAPVEQVAHDLSDRFRALTGGSRTVVARQQTLLASVEWSHALLSSDEQVLFRRLAVFLADFSVDAAEAVAADASLDGYRVLELLGNLVDKSLVQLDDTSGRYQLLETIRQYALDRCVQFGELEELRDRHLAWAVSVVDSQDHDLCDESVIAAFDAEYPNLRTALEWATETRSPLAFELVDGLAHYWGLSGTLRDAISMADPVLAEAKAADRHLWARLVSLLSWVRLIAGDFDFMNQTAEAVVIAHDRHDAGSEARCLYAIGGATTGDSELLERVFELGREANDTRFTNYGALVTVISLLGTDRAESLFARAESLGQGFDDDTFHFLMLGWMTLHRALRGEQQRARLLALEALEHESRATGAVFEVVAAAMFTALQGGDTDLLRQAADYVQPALRDLPGSQWWGQLIDDALRRLTTTGAFNELPVPPAVPLILANSELVVRLLLSDHRFDDALSWIDQLPPTWPSAHAGGSLARAWIAFHRDDSTAMDQIHDALDEVVDLGLRPATADALELVAAQRATRGDHLGAARLLGAAQAARDDMGVIWRYPYHQAAVDDALERTRGALDEPAFQTAYDAGAQSSLMESVQFAQRMRGDRRRPSHGWAALTPTERAVADEIAAGRSNAEAAQRLFVAPSTIKSHLEHIYAKLGVRSRAALATEAAKNRTS
jgi:predicted ATPase/class 3 adenylate cyclase/DNA-binding CsgD family transcriptional regulator